MQMLKELLFHVYTGGVRVTSNENMANVLSLASDNYDIASVKEDFKNSSYIVSVSEKFIVRLFTCDS